MNHKKSKSPNPVDQHVGSRIRMRRVMVRMTQMELDDKLGLTFQQVQKYEKGANRVGASRLQHVAHILQVPVEFFFEGLATPEGKNGPLESPALMAEINRLMATHEGLTLARAFMKIRNVNLRRQIASLVNDLEQGGGGRS